MNSTNIELDSTENRAFRSAGDLLAEVSPESKELIKTLTGIDFPMVTPDQVNAMKKALTILSACLPKMNNYQYQVFTNIGNDLAHLKALKS